ncbi:hypothetical protein E0L93_02095 [Rubrobacter taiwanensis]|uniref:Uncharacterized protein n=1 Tax=Rubrobacter taiwanensis TaxID=185139 RepID=A0A4R1BRD9_9ACTN|nr:hypothetical protein [Rubrobacter taiwanensis]TCJ20201.1 hypothetical protein E0L93_02095 [Rubrobacter taiwanensis]
MEPEPARDFGPAAGGLVAGITLAVILAAVAFSVWLVIYTAWVHDAGGGAFALAFAVLSAKAALSWLSWHGGSRRKRL